MSAGDWTKILPSLAVGMVVYDRRYEMPGTITDFDGPMVCLTRPTGLAWRSHCASVRPATAYERRQLRALARLHAQRQRGIAPA
ncbi:hypothetical protein B7755_020890 [Streptomyces sp. NBS 14/10]|uniref:hypothetical protein n=1 Tax=Streptomyces sp. NBS 14/10 TaxID=1945643 RepID=UPI000B7D42C9|nr:hypothetical protein [Streptomyces sp. NBS 14/10]KAK1180384.1 hypothetical protein B7755_020890 [Streptomyces sp. NBS 14/10]